MALKRHRSVQVRAYTGILLGVAALDIGASPPGYKRLWGTISRRYVVKAFSFVLFSFVLFSGVFIPRMATAQETVLVLPVRGSGLDHPSLDSATTSIRRRLEEQSYIVRVLESNVPGVDVSVGELGNIAQQNHARMIVDPVLQDFAGMTSLRIRVVNADGSLLGEEADIVEPATLPQTASQVLARILSSASITTPQMESPFDVEPREGPQQQQEIQIETPVQRPPRVQRRRRRRPQFPERKFRLGLVLEPALGTNRSSMSMFAGARFEFNWRGLLVGANFHYTYIQDWEPRSDPSYHSFALFGMVGYKIRLGSERLFLPVAIGGGYILGNGGLLRIEAGLAIRPIDRLDIRIIFVCPNFWFVNTVHHTGEEAIEESQTIVFTSISLGINVAI